MILGVSATWIQDWGLKRENAENYNSGQFSHSKADTSSCCKNCVSTPGWRRMTSLLRTLLEYQCCGLIAHSNSKENPKQLNSWNNWRIWYSPVNIYFEIPTEASTKLGIEAREAYLHMLAAGDEEKATSWSDPEGTELPTSAVSAVSSWCY